MKARGLTFFLTAVLAIPSIAWSGGPSHAGAPVQEPDREIQALMLALKLLEEKPFDAKAKDVRTSAMKWIVDTDKVNVTICSLIVKNVDEKYTYKSELLVQYTIGMAAFKLSKASDATDEDAAQLAGVESAMTAYQAIMKEKPAAKNSFMEDLITRKAKNELASYVKKNNCEQDPSAGKRIRF